MKPTHTTCMYVCNVRFDVKMKIISGITLVSKEHVCTAGEVLRHSER